MLSYSQFVNEQEEAREGRSFEVRLFKDNGEIGSDYGAFLNKARATVYPRIISMLSEYFGGLKEQFSVYEFDQSGVDLNSAELYMSYIRIEGKIHDVIFKYVTEDYFFRDLVNLKSKIVTRNI